MYDGRYGNKDVLLNNYDALKVTRDWLDLPVLDFRMKYGFSFVPPMWLRCKAEKKKPRPGPGQ